MKKKIIYKAILFLIFSFIAGCSNKKPDTSSINKEFSSSEIEQSENDLEDVYYLLPSPYEVLSIINETNIRFDSKLLNPLDNIERYNTESKQSQNLGIYMMDFAYCAMFSQEYKAREYLKGTYELSARNRMNTILPQELYSDIEHNGINIDSLYVRFNDFYFEVISRLEESQRIKSLIYISAGAYIECVHIANAHANSMGNDPSIIIKIAEQKFLFENLYNYAAKTLEKEDEVFIILTEIEECYNKLVVEMKNPYKITKNEDGTLNIKGGIHLYVNDDYFSEFCSKISVIREKIIN